MKDYVIAIFSVRTSTMQFSNLLNKNGVKSIVIETPKSASASCGISVRFTVQNLTKARQLLASSKINNFVRFYLVTEFYGKKTLRPI